MSRPAAGAYGFRLLLDGSGGDDDLIAVAAGAPAVRVTAHHASFAVDREEVSDERVVFGGAGGSGFCVRRDPAGIDVFIPAELSRAALVHPILTVPISVLARWTGAVTLHAGAFEAHGGAWAVLGGREAGKSTTLASMASRGCAVLADDLLVIEDLQVRSGPCCVDLRPDVADRFAGSRIVGEVGGRERHRLRTRAGSPSAPLRGFVDLRWHDDPGVRIERMPTAELLRLLYAQEYIGLLGPADPVKILELLALPAWRVSRRRDWSATDELGGRLLALAEANA